MRIVSLRLKAALFLPLVLVLMGATVLHAANDDPPRIQIEVTKKDSLGRVQVMEVRAGTGTCIAEIIYEGGPRVHVVVIAQNGIRNLGFAAIGGETAKNLDNEVLVRIFETTIRQHCLPLIVPSYAET